MVGSLVDKVSLFFIKDRKLLMTRDKNKVLYTAPGGKKKENETNKQALIREIKEELSVDLKPSTIKYYKTFQAQAFGKPEGIMVRSICYTGQFDGEPKPSAEIAEIAWFFSGDGDKTTTTGRLVLEDLEKNNLID